MAKKDFFTKLLLLRQQIKDMLTSPKALSKLGMEGKSTYGHIVKSLHHEKGVLVKYRFHEGRKAYEGWSHYTGKAFKNALNVGNHIKIVYVKGRPRGSRWVEDDLLAPILPYKKKAGIEKEAGGFREQVNKF